MLFLIVLLLAMQSANRLVSEAFLVLQLIKLAATIIILKKNLRWQKIKIKKACGLRSIY